MASTITTEPPQLKKTFVIPQLQMLYGLLILMMIKVENPLLSYVLL
jgi:hypothetical protein